MRRWYGQDWLTIDPKLRSSIIEGLSVFLSVFDLPDVAATFCPPKPAAEPPAPPGGHAAETAAVSRQLPRLDEVIDSGKVLCLNMPAGTNPALSRAVGVMLKQAWLQTLLRRPAEMARRPARVWRPAMFLCDEYQSFVTVGEDDPAGDEKMFALTRQSRLIPIVATQSISSLRAVLGQSEAWRALLQTLRTRIFLSLADDSSAQIASTLPPLSLPELAVYFPECQFVSFTWHGALSILYGLVGNNNRAAIVDHMESLAERAFCCRLRTDDDHSGLVTPLAISGTHVVAAFCGSHRRSPAGLFRSRRTNLFEDHLFARRHRA